ncbi:hypothetical protein LSAT2_024961, partial [Lamellibrachia satsuma]
EHSMLHTENNNVRIRVKTLQQTVDAITAKNIALLAEHSTAMIASVLERRESGCHANILSVVVRVILIPSLVNKYHLVLCWLRGGVLFSRAQERYYDPHAANPVDHQGGVAMILHLICNWLHAPRTNGVCVSTMHNFVCGFDNSDKVVCLTRQFIDDSEPPGDGARQQQAAAQEEGAQASTSASTVTDPVEAPAGVDGDDNDTDEYHSGVTAALTKSQQVSDFVEVPRRRVHCHRKWASGSGRAIRGRPHRACG